MLFIYIIPYQSVSLNKIKIVSPSTFVNNRIRDLRCRMSYEHLCSQLKHTYGE